MVRRNALMPDDRPQPLSGDKSGPLENMITCSNCGMVYDTRFLAEYCRRVEGEGFRCRECNSLLVNL
jgi:hypothetical protein